MRIDQLRPECGRAGDNVRKVVGVDALKMVLRSINKRRGLISGALDQGEKHCALGCFFADYPRTAIETRIAEMVAAENDSLSKRAKPKTRWKKVQRWLKREIALMTVANRGVEQK